MLNFLFKISACLYLKKGAFHHICSKHVIFLSVLMITIILNFYLVAKNIIQIRGGGGLHSICILCIFSTYFATRESETT